MEANWAREEQPQDTVWPSDDMMTVVAQGEALLVSSDPSNTVLPEEQPARHLRAVESPESPEEIVPPEVTNPSDQQVTTLATHSLRRQRSLRHMEAEDLLAAAREGDREAFDQLVRDTYADAYTLALRLTGNEEDAADVVQDAYLRAFRGLKKFRGDAQFSTWMYRIVANCAYTSLTKRKRLRHDAIDEEEHVVVDHRPEVDPQLVAEATSLRDRVSVALDDLSPRLRSVVVLRDVYDMPHNDIAEALGTSEAATKVRLHRARRKLHEQLFPLKTDETE